MKKAASIFLRAEIEMNDIELLIRWMKNPNVTRYLNEDPNVVYSLRRISQSVPEPMLTYHFNRTERFFFGLPRRGRSHRLRQAAQNRGKRRLRNRLCHRRGGALGARLWKRRHSLRTVNGAFGMARQQGCGKDLYGKCTLGAVGARLRLQPKR